MNSFPKSSRHGEKGFTLIELLVVIAILGILAAIAIPNVAKMLGTSTLNAANTEVANVKTAAVAYSADNNGTWPADSSFLTPYLAGALKADYSFGADGLISGGTAHAGEYVGLTFNTTLQLWEK